MKKLKIIFVYLFLVSGFIATAQSKDEKQVIERTYLLSHTVFGTKDSMTLEDLFAKTATYGHSHGKVQTRREAIDGISHNQSIYTDTAVSNITVIFAGDVAIARHIFMAKENTKDGKVTPLHFNMMLVWVKEDGKWRLFGRQAVSLDQ